MLAEKFDIVYHLAAEVGAGLSMADPQKFMRVNAMGQANVLEELRAAGAFPKKLIIASSATVYGEATYECVETWNVLSGLAADRPARERGVGTQVSAVRQGYAGRRYEGRPPVEPSLDLWAEQARYRSARIRLLGRAWGITFVAFRPFGVFGPRQSLGNPYTGVLALFATRIFAGQPVMHYEDGKQNKSYIYIDDAISALLLAMEKDEANGKVFNLGTEEPGVTIRYIAESLAKQINPSVEVIATGKFRPGDTRHMWPDNSYLRRTLGWEPKVSFDEGMKRMVDWLRTFRSKR